MTIRNYRNALMGSGVVLAVAAASLPASAGDIDDMRAQIQALQDKIAKIEAQEQRRVAPAAAVEAGSRPKSWKLPGTNTSMNIGGFAILQFDYDLNGQIGYLPAGPSPTDGSNAANRQNQFSLTAQQSRFFITTSTPTDWGDLITHIEIDMNGGTRYSAGQGMAMRGRKAYGQLGPVLAGQETTTFFTPGAGERTDVATPFLGSSAFRMGQVRYTHSFGGGTRLMVALEDNIGFSDTGAATPGVVGAVANNVGVPPVPTSITSVAGFDVNETPSFVAQIQHAWSSGSVGLAGMVRKLGVDTGGPASATAGAAHDSVASYGMSLGAGWIISKQFRVGAQFLYGEGLGIYSGGNFVMATAEGFNSDNFQLDTVRTIGGAAFIQWRFTDTMRVNLLYGREQYHYDIDKAALPLTGATVGSGTPAYFQQIVGNIMWEPVPAVNIGLQYLYGFAGLNNGPNATQSRLELAFRYNF